VPYDHHPLRKGTCDEEATGTGSAARAALDDQGDISFLGVPVGTLCQWHYRGEGPQPYKVVGHLRYDPRALIRWLEESAA